MRLSHKVAFNTSVQILGKLTTAFFGFLITIIVARFYGVAGFGEFTKITAYVALFYLVADFGFNAVFLKEEKKEKIEFVNLFSLRLIWGAILTFLAIALLIFFPENQINNSGFPLLVKLGIIITAPTIITQAVFISFNALFQKDLRYDKSVIAATVSGLVTVILVYLFSILHFPLVLLMSSYFFSGLTLVVVLFIAGRKYLGKNVDLTTQFLTQNLHSWKILFKKALPLGLTLIFNLIYFRADIFILSFFRSNEEVGIYGLAYKFFEFPLAVPTFFMNAVYPLMLTYNKQQTINNKIIGKSKLFLVFSSVLLTIGCLLLAPFISLVKTDFSASILPFRILVLSLPIFFLSSLYMWLLIAQGRQKELLRIYGLGMVLNIILNLLFIPQFGYLAAAIITLVSEGFVLLLLFSKRNIKTGKI